MSEYKKILLNSIILYVRMFFSAIISIYATRLILSSLGVDDFGIFNLVVGAISLFTFVNGAMGTTTQRFISHSMGKDDVSIVRRIFSTSLFIHIIIALLIVLVLVISSKYLVFNYLNIPFEKKELAVKVLYFFIFSTFFSIVTTPFDGSLVANENFLIIAVLEVSMSVLKLLSAIYLTFTVHEKLIVYAVIISFGTIILSLFKMLYCSYKYTECTVFPKCIDKTYSAEILSFAGWNLFGSLCSIAKGQGLAVAMNFYFGVVANAAYGISSQISNQVSMLSSVVTKAIYPQLMKSEGNGNRELMLRFSQLTTQLPYILILFIGMPLYIEMDFVLKLWLTEVPEFSLLLSKLMLILALVSSLSYGQIAAIQSIGIIKVYQIIVGTLLIIILPISVLLFKLEFSLYWGIIVSIVIEIFAHFFRLYYLRQFAKISIKDYIINVDIKLVIITFLVFIITYFIANFNFNPYYKFFSVVLSSSIVLFVSTYYIVFTKETRLLLISYVKSKF